MEQQHEPGAPPPGMQPVQRGGTAGPALEEAAATPSEGGTSAAGRFIDWVSEPSAEQLDAWHKEHGEENVRYTQFPTGVQFYFRLLTRTEYKALIYGPFGVEQRENEMCRCCVLWPVGLDYEADFKGNLNGVPSMLVEYIMDQSGFYPAIVVKKV